LHTQEGETVLDPFMGSAGTAIACLKLGRKFIGIELDEKWFECSVARIEGWLLSQPRLAGLVTRKLAVVTAGGKPVQVKQGHV
jgi:DNA modification methylase